MKDKVKVIYKKKKSTGKTITIIILLLLLVCSISYIVYNEYRKEKEPVEEKEEKELSYKEVQNMLNQIEVYNNLIAEAYPIKDINKLDNQLKLNFGIWALIQDENITNYYSIEDIKEMYNNYFKEGFSAIYEDIKCKSDGEVLYELNSNTKTYTVNSEHVHGSTSITIDTFLVSAKQDGNKYKINTNILYSNYCNETCDIDNRLYDSFQKAVEKKDNQVAFLRKEYKEIKDTLPITVFTFEKVKNNYKLESIEIK